MISLQEGGTRPSSTAAPSPLSGCPSLCASPPPVFMPRFPAPLPLQHRMFISNPPIFPSPLLSFFLAFPPYAMFTVLISSRRASSNDVPDEAPEVATSVDPLPFRHDSRI